MSSSDGNPPELEKRRTISEPPEKTRTISNTDNGGDTGNRNGADGEENPPGKKSTPAEESGGGSGHGGHGGSPAPSGDYIKPPDGGWGWFVVFSSFMIHVIADGIVYSFGIFLTELVDYFGAGRGEITWVGSLQPAITFTVGPLSSVLTNRYGCRATTIAGALVAALGFVFSVWAPNHYYLYLTSGVMVGIGFGLIYLPAIVCVAQYFEKKRSFATGLAVCGSGFGTFILAPICKILIEEYSWRGAMLLLGGFTLNIVVCGIIFRPLEEDSENKKDEVRKEIEVTEGNAVEKERLLGDNGVSADKPGQDDGLEISENATKPPEVVLSSSLPKSEVIIIDGPGGYGSATNGKVSNGDLAKLSASQSLMPKAASDLDPALLARSDGALHHQAVMKATKASTGNGKPTSSDHKDHAGSPRRGSKSHLQPLQRKDIFYSGSLLNIPLYRSQPDIYHREVAGKSSRSSSIDHHHHQHHHQHHESKLATVADDDKDSSGDTSRSGGDHGRIVSEFVGVWLEFKSTMKSMMSMELLLNPVFLMFGISNFLTSIGFNMPFIFLPDRAEVAGIDATRAAYLLSVIGIANTVGRMVFGYLSDRPWVNRLMLYNSALTVCGVATALSPGVGGNYTLLVVYAAVFGLFIGVYVSLTSVVLVDLLGLELLTNSFGLLLLFQGVATFIGPPIAGWLYDWTGSYDISFIAMGTLIALSGAMLFFLPPIQRRHERRLTRAALSHDADMGRHILQGSKKDVDIGLVEMEEVR